MDRTVSLVAEFHKAFDIDNRRRPGLPSMLDDTRAVLEETVQDMESLAKRLMRLAGERPNVMLTRLQLCQEEAAELGRAMADDDLVGCLDALCDMRYVADGTTLALGLQYVFADAFDEVHRSNMAKLVDGVPVKNEAGRVMKPRDWTPPDLTPILVDGGF